MRAHLLVIALVSITGCEGETRYPILLESRKEASEIFADPETECSECHPDHVAEWRISNHAYAARDPAFVAMAQVGQAQTNGKLGTFCTSCHAPAAEALGMTPLFFDEVRRRHNQRLKGLNQPATQGVSCSVCHSMTEVLDTKNAKFVMSPDGVQRGSIRDPIPNKAHKSLFVPEFSNSIVCAPCHSVVNGKGALIEQTYVEWQFSSFATKGEQCQSCHMPAYRGRVVPDGPERELHRHYMVGVDVSLLPEDEFPGYHEMRELTAALLREAAEFSVTYSVDGRRLDAVIVNRTGHALPSGATADRQVWIEIIVTDEAGEEVFTSGTLDANGDVKDAVPEHNLEAGTDPHLAYYGQQPLFVPALVGVEEKAEIDAIHARVSAACLPTGVGVTDATVTARPVTFPWLANWQCESLIPADATVRAVYPMDTLPPGAYSASAKLFYRTFPPHVMRKLEQLGGLDPAVNERVPIVKMAEELVRFRVDP